jgi:hypothetical protein
MVGKESGGDASFHSKAVFDRRSGGAVLARVDQHVGSDLRDGGLEQDEVAIAGGKASPLAKQLHRAVKSVQSIVQAGEGGFELKRLGDPTVRVRSQ